MAEHRFFIMNSAGVCVWIQPPVSGATEERPLEDLGGTLQAPIPATLDMRKPPFPAADALIDLLGNGWRPIRETSMGDGHVLILLERG